MIPTAKCPLCTGRRWRPDDPHEGYWLCGICGARAWYDQAAGLMHLAPLEQSASGVDDHKATVSQAWMFGECEGRENRVFCALVHGSGQGP